jgi:hypothetical protein
MKRCTWTFCLILLTALGVLVPAGAQAATLASVPLTSGKPVNAVISAPGQQLTYTFAAKANKHVTFQVTKFNLSNNGSGGSAYLNFYEPGSSSSYTSCYISSNTWCDFTPPLGGTWKVVLAPNSASVGSLTLTFANDVPTVALAPGTPVSTTIKFQGQNAGYTFPATAQGHVTFDVTQFNLSNNGSGGSAYLYFYQPGSTSAYTSCYISSNTWCDFTPLLTGTWKVGLDPNSGSVGSLTLTFANDVPTQALTSGTPVTTKIRFQGQNAGYTFSTKAGANKVFNITQFSFSNGGSGGSAYLNFYEPGSSSSYASCYISSNTTCPVTTPVGGTWKATLDPNSASVGSLTLTMS